MSSRFKYVNSNSKTPFEKEKYDNIKQTEKIANSSQDRTSVEMITSSTENTH